MLTRPLQRCYFLISRLRSSVRRQQKTPASLRGPSIVARSPHLAEYCLHFSCTWPLVVVTGHWRNGWLTLRRNWHPSCYFASGLPGFIGPFPSTSLDESRSYCIYSIVGYFRVVSKYTEGVLALSRGRIFWNSESESCVFWKMCDIVTVECCEFFGS